MSLTLDALKIDVLVQKVVPEPFTFDVSTYQLVDNKSYNIKMHKIIRQFYILTLVLIDMPISALRTLWLLFNWDEMTWDDIIGIAKFDAISYIQIFECFV